MYAYLFISIYNVIENFFCIHMHILSLNISFCSVSYNYCITFISREQVMQEHVFNYSYHYKYLAIIYNCVKNILETWSEGNSY